MNKLLIILCYFQNIINDFLRGLIMKNLLVRSCLLCICGYSNAYAQCPPISLEALKIAIEDKGAITLEGRPWTFNELPTMSELIVAKSALADYLMV